MVNLCSRWKRGDLESILYQIIECPPKLVAQECSATMLDDATSILENRRIAYMQGDSSLLDFLMSVRVYNDTAEQCIEAKAGLATATTELLRAIGL